MLHNSSTQAITARGLSKRFGSVQAVSNLDLDVRAGEALGLLGPNGAGKSTTLSMLMGLRQPDAGETLIFGHQAGSPQARALTGATPQIAGFPEQLTPREILTYTAARYGVSPRIDEAVARFGLEKIIDRRAAGFSGGEMRRVALALAFCGRPKLVFLDEPTAGLDVTAQEGFQAVAREYVAQGGALVLTSHHWDEIEAICGSIAMIDQGETVLHGSIDDLRGRMGATRLRFEMAERAELPAWLAATPDEGAWQVETADSDSVLRKMVTEGVPFHNLSITPLDLKDLIHRIRNEETQK